MRDEVILVDISMRDKRSTKVPTVVWQLSLEQYNYATIDSTLIYANSVENHIGSGRVELGISFDDFVD
jgi:hypothetical protein